MKARFLALAALVLGLASCQNDPEIVNPVVGGEVDFQLAVGVPELGTRAAADGTNDSFNHANSAYGAIDYLQGVERGDDYRTDWGEVDIRYSLEVYDKADSYTSAVPVKDRQVIIVDEYKPVAFDLRLVPGREYHFVVFADFVPNGSKVEEVGKTLTEHHKELGLHHFIGDNLGQITIKADGINDECTDAYFATRDITISNSAAQDMELKRPYGKLRVIATDLAELNINVDPAAVVVTYDAYHPNAFNAVTGAIDGEYETKEYVSVYNEGICKLNLANHFYTEDYDNKKATNKDGVQRHTHMTLFTDYILANEQQAPIHFTMNVYQTATKNGEEYVFSNPIKSTHFNTEIPIQRNFLTTIVGNVLTTATEIKVTIDDNFSNANNWTDKPFYQEVWDGETLTKPTTPAVDEDGNVIENTLVISQPSELAWFAAAVNGTLVESNSTRANEDYTKMNFVLTQDINLNNEAWTPIGTSSKPYYGTFDGQGHKISNLFVDGGSSSNQGLFGVTHNGEIKDLVVENAKVSGRLNVAVVCGQPYTSKYTNITVKGHVEVNGMAYVGGVGGKNAYADWTNVTVNADETSYVKANSVENGTAYRTYVGGVCGFNGEGGHSFKNITSNINVKGSTCDVGGLFGIAHYGNQFEECSCSGNVEIYAAEEADEAQEIGGIAGVWHNATGYSVEMANCSFNGTLKTNIEGVNFYYGGLVGKPYGDGEGKLYLNGYEMVANGVGVKDDAYYVFNAEGLQTLAEMVENENEVDAEILLGGDIDLSELVLTRATTSNWVPVGTSEKPFTGTFDGRGYTIKNLALVEQEAKEGKAYIGFFGYAKDATIKNVTFENVYINIPCLDIDHSQGHIGAVAGSLEGTSTIENVTVKGDIKVYATQNANGASRVAVVAGGNSYGNVTMKNVHVIANEGSYLKANNNTGALAGQLQGKMYFENCTSNIDVTVNKFFAGGLIGIAAGDSYFKECHTTGDVAVVAGREGRHNDEYRVGGIAGGWADGKTKVCTLEKCSYTGNVSGTNADGSVANPLDYDGYVGRGYTLSNCAGSKVVIDGVEYVQKYDNVYGVYTINGLTPVATADELVAALEAKEGVLFMDDIKIDPASMSNAYGATGINVKYGQTIDGNGHTLNIKGAGGTWDSGINTTGGLIKNLTVTGSFRGIFINHTSDHSEKVVLENVTIGDNGTVYTISCDQGLYQGIEATNCTFNGWTSFAKTAGEAKFVNCNFGEGSGYKYCRPYSNTEFIKCTFCPGYAVDETQATVTFTDCTWEE